MIWARVAPPVEMRFPGSFVNHPYQNNGLKISLNDLLTAQSDRLASCMGLRTEGQCIVVINKDFNNNNNNNNNNSQPFM
jgi:hypothetical protein